jgi:chemotaxis protein MotA
MALVLAAVVLAFGTLTAGNPRMFLDFHAWMIVVGGSVAASSICFQVDRIFLLFKVFVRRVIQGRKENYVLLIEELMALSEAYRTSSPGLQKLIDESKDPFLKDAMTALLDEVITGEDLIRLVRTRMETVYHRQNEDAIKFRTVGKFPPAFGLMGTTLSMITLLQNLGQPGGQKLIGPAMSIGLVATFLGLAFANLIFIPVSENLADGAKENRLKNLIIVEGLRLIQARTNPVVLAEELNSFLLPSERVDWKKAVSGERKAA